MKPGIYRGAVAVVALGIFLVASSGCASRRYHVPAAADRPIYRQVSATEYRELKLQIIKADYSFTINGWAPWLEMSDMMGCNDYDKNQMN